mmetsp:Transcript_3034/g.6656  ORF Transcript_3034/g.6656 Transcript_3034/m.6656 type:complete len:382 (+) Transcript_3034:88-1233(+)|eukprot:CAMPEP_0172322104 /NCGR_PEP_ID=MMETSP1058-20130122/45031_1 /TAXON_ID=83371 /ORGANISM="Detonula confervacea, Strain CCMP 353" /LENGTH=381 /DNA_ID=CAMNT_0013037753 /DNA_START=66 /DNA_END=1211 /DNA_ORIENTATION=-
MSLNYFTPIPGLIGGSLIGLSAATLLLFNGDILGASGLMSSFVSAPMKTLTDPSQQWKLAFLAAFCLTTRLYVTLIDPDALKDERLGYSSGLPIVSPLGFILGGFCVGFGTRMGNGCTTGHGICGMARLSARSGVAVLAFMATGILSASGCSATCPFHPYLRDTYESIAEHLPTETTITIGTVIASLAAGAALPGFLRKAPRNATKTEQDEHDNNKRKIIPAIISASFFSLGLVISKMTISSKIYGFLNMKGFKDGTWDPTLACVMGGGLVVSFLSYQWVKGFNSFKNTKALECPLSQKSAIGHFNVPTNKVIDKKLIIGEAIFGLGWGMAGLCPGPAMFLACAGYPNVLLRWWPSFFVGSFLAEKLKSLSVKMQVSPAKK